MRKATIQLAHPLVLTFAAGAACTSTGELDESGGNGPSGAELQVVGEENLSLEAGESADLAVRYEGPGGDPLAADVSFAFEDDADVAYLSAQTVSTGDDGVARTTVSAGDGGGESFGVVADAPEAEPVAWEVEVESRAPLSASGRYAFTSYLDFASGAPGEAGEVLNLLLDMTDHPADPTYWVAERIMDELPISRDIPESMARTVNNIVMDVTGLEPMFDRLGQFGEAATNFGLRSTIEIDGEGSGATATHTLDGVVFQIDGALHDYSFDDMSIESPVTGGVNLSVDEGADYLGIEEHDLAIPYGGILRHALEQGVLGGATLEELLVDGEACDVIAAELVDRLGLFFGEGTVASACRTVLSRGVGAIMDRVESLEATTATLRLRGDAVPVDVAGDRRVDRIAEGAWDGELTISGRSTRLLPEDNPFSAERTGS